MTELFDDRPAIKPVWQVIPQFFRYPFKANVLPMLVIISLASALTLIPFLGFFVWILLWVMLFKISYEILSSTASGEMDGPASVTGMSDGIMFKHIGLLILMAFGYVFLVGFTGSPVVAVALGLFLMLALPAAIMTLAMTQSLLSALNPVTWITIMRTTGASYLLTSVFLLLMMFSQAQAEALLFPVVGGSLIALVILSTFISAYFMAASFHLMGYLLYQHHEEFGIDAAVTSDAGSSGKGDNPLVEEAGELVREGRADEAVRFLGEEIRQRGGEPPVHDFYRKLLQSRGERQALVEHGRQYLPMLIHGIEDMARAVEVAEECLKIDSGFEFSNPDDVLPIARLAFQQGRHDLVLRISSGFGKKHRDHPDGVEIYFLAARSLVEHKGQFEKAAALARQLKKRYPDHALAGEIARLEAVWSSDRAGYGTGPAT